MSSTPFTHDEIRAAAETHSELGRELGPEYQSAVIESFLDKVGREIDARVDARMAAPRLVRPGRGHYPFALAVGMPATGLAGLLVIWAAITAINVVYALHVRPPSGRR